MASNDLESRVDSSWVNSRFMTIVEKFLGHLLVPGYSTIRLMKLLTDKKNHFDELDEAEDVDFITPICYIGTAVIDVAKLAGLIYFLDFRDY